MRVLTAEQFFNSDDLPLHPVPLPEDLYGKDVGFFVRTMPGAERSELEKVYMNKDAAEDPGGFRANLLVQTVVDADGKAVFTVEQVERLMAKNSGTLETLFDLACKLNAFREKDVVELEKN